MGKFSFKCVTKEAQLACTNCPGNTLFIAPVPNQPIAKEQNRELAVKDDLTIVPFAGVCAPVTGPCVPALTEWQFIDPQMKLAGISVLVDKSVNVCAKAGFITISDKKQDIITVDLAGLVLKAIKALDCMLDFRLDQFNNDKPAFDTAFDTWFGAGHTDAEKQVIMDRMNNVKRLTAKMVNADGTLNEDYFEPVNAEDDYDSYAYVYRNDPDNVVHTAPLFFADGVNVSGMDSQAGTIGHEASHFDSILGVATAGTTDRDSAGNLVYGVGPSQNLALNDPSQALIHADSFEFFLESGGPCP